MTSSITTAAAAAKSTVISHHRSAIARQWLDKRDSCNGSCCGVSPVTFSLLQCTKVGRAMAAQCMSMLAFSMNNSCYSESSST
jgi:hypothetical protein